MQHLRATQGSLHNCTYLKGPLGPPPAPWPWTCNVPGYVKYRPNALPEIALFSKGEATLSGLKVAGAPRTLAEDGLPPLDGG